MQAVCKHYCGLERASSYFREKAALEAIRDARCEADKEQGRSVWPKLLSANDQQHVLVTQPVVKQMGKWLRYFGCKGSLRMHTGHAAQGLAIPAQLTHDLACYPAPDLLQSTHPAFPLAMHAMQTT